MAITCTGVILAGGQSSRMGQDKAELNRNGLSMLVYCRHLLEQCPVDDILISRNCGEGLRDIYPHCGPLGGIHAAVVNAQTDALLILPVDMPLLEVEELLELVRHGQNTMKPTYYHDCYLPLYLPLCDDVREYLAQQLKTNGNLKVRGLIEHFDGVALPSANLHCLINTNTPEQWQATLQQISNRG